jgi:prepilin-type N-terminal cleavage/methylation domain-containing protein
MTGSRGCAGAARLPETQEMRSSKGGFTLVELLVVIAIIGTEANCQRGGYRQEVGIGA